MIGYELLLVLEQYQSRTLWYLKAIETQNLVFKGNNANDSKVYAKATFRPKATILLNKM